jgi:Autotransporter beta-domain
MKLFKSILVSSSLVFACAAIADDHGIDIGVSGINYTHSTTTNKPDGADKQTEKSSEFRTVLPRITLGADYDDFRTEVGVDTAEKSGNLVQFYKFNDNFHLGLGLTFQRTSQPTEEKDSNNATVELDDINSKLLISPKFKFQTELTDEFGFYGILAPTFIWASAEKESLSGTTQTTAEVKSNGFGVSVELGFPLSLAKNFRLSPKVQFAYASLNIKEKQSGVSADSKQTQTTFVIEPVKFEFLF